MLIFVTVSCVPGCIQSGSQDGKQEQLANDTSLQSKKVEFVAFCAKWCEVCREVPPLLSHLQRDFPAVSFRELDVDDEDNFKLYLKYKGDKTDGLPYLFVIIDGEVVAQLRGILPYEKVVSFLRGAIRQHATGRS
jgi:thiol-disulfide isomerase/thioredoxin